MCANSKSIIHVAYPSANIPHSIIVVSMVSSSYSSAHLHIVSHLYQFLKKLYGRNNIVSVVLNRNETNYGYQRGKMVSLCMTLRETNKIASEMIINYISIRKMWCPSLSGSIQYKRFIFATCCFCFCLIFF